MKSSLLIRSLLALTFSLALAAVARSSVVERPVSSVSLTSTLADAQALASRHTDMQVLRISGRSMLPFFGEGSVVIIKKIEANLLHPGMVVVYRNNFGETVAHRIVSSAAAGWVVQGYNNTAVDSTIVSGANLMGVVYATFHSNGQTNEVSGLASAMNQTQIALAAPAK